MARTRELNHHRRLIRGVVPLLSTGGFEHDFSELRAAPDWDKVLTEQETGENRGLPGTGCSGRKPLPLIRVANSPPLRSIAALLAVAAGLAVSTPARALLTRVSVYSTNNYNGCAGGSLPNSIANGDGFRNTLVNAPNSIWTNGLRRTNNQVADRDLCDPQLNGSCRDNNSNSGFDRSGNNRDALAYYTGHGWCGPGGRQGQDSPRKDCTSTTQCTTPNGGNLTTPGACVAFPPNIDGPGTQREPRCAYAYTHRAVVCSNNSAFSQLVRYSSAGTGTRIAAWGESPEAGGWAGVGTNGGVNLVVMDISCGGHPGSEWVDFGAEAGMHLFLTIAPHRNGDTINVPARGSKFANGYVTGGQDSLVVFAWWAAKDMVTGGSGCNGDTGQSGTGLSGCGSYMAVAKDATVTEAQDRFFSTWADLQNENLDPDSGAEDHFVRSSLACNYDCDQYPPVIF